jgi:formylmethanofuran dehydrogenase subunit B
VAERGPLTCAGCGLLCDDVRVERSDRAVSLRPACRVGADWFSERMPTAAGGPAATIDGQPTGVQPALVRAAELLRGARRPLLHGFDGATVEDARAAFALADRLGALVVTEGLGNPWPGAPALPLRGASSATLGEIRDRSELVVIWREDPETTHPRLLERLGCGLQTPSRLGVPSALVVIDDRDTATAARADLQLRWPPEHDLEALVTLAVLHRGLEPPPGDLAQQGEALVQRIGGVPHLAFVYGFGLVAGRGGQRRALALHELVRSLCHERHAVTLELPRAAGTRGAQDALAWQTGYAGNVDLAGGHPELVTATRPLGSDEGVDVTLCVEGAPAPAAAGTVQIALGGRPRGSAGSAPVAGSAPAVGSAPTARAGSEPAGAPESEPAVWVRTAAAGVEAVGTAHRLDGVPLTLQAPWAGQAPTAAVLLTRLLAEVEA